MTDAEYQVIKESYPYSERRLELLMASSSATLPTDVPAGSVAYTADLTYMAMFDGTNWVRIGGGS